MVFEKIYDFDSIGASSNADWEFINPNGTTGLREDGVGRCWNWEDKRTRSSRVGPDGPYTGMGYIYSESSTPTRDNDKFIMVTKNNIDASARNTKLSFRFSADTNNNEVQLIVEIYSDGGWHKEFDKNVKSYKRDWLLVDLDLARYHNTDMLIRITIDMLVSGSTSSKDVGIDHVVISGTEVVGDEITEFLGKRSVRRLRKNVNTFDAEHMSNTDIKAMIDGMKVTNPSYVNYPRGVLIIESRSKVHLIKEEY